MALEYRVVHLATLLGGIALLFTGVGSYPGSPKVFPHDALGISSIVVLSGYGVYLLAIRGVRLFDGLRKPVSDQKREAIAIFRNYTLGSPVPPEVRQRIARHNVPSSYASILLTISFVQLMISGVFLILLAPGSSLYGVMQQIHNYGVGLTALFVFLHLAAVSNVANRPLLRAVFTNGKVPLVWVKEHWGNLSRTEI